MKDKLHLYENIEKMVSICLINLQNGNEKLVNTSLLIV